MRVQVTQYVNDKLAALRINPAGVDPEDDGEEGESDEEVDESGPSSKRVKLEPKVAPVGTELKNRIQPPVGYAYGNASVLRCNAMKFLSNFFEKAQVSSFPLFVRPSIS